MELGLKGRAALVAGSSRGLGRAAAEALAAEGVNLALCARGEQALAETAGRIAQKNGVKVFHRAVDVTDFEAVKKLVADAHKRFGRLDILVTNAGGPPGGSFADFSMDDWQRAVELNFLASTAMIRAAGEIMRPAKWGRIVNLTSVSVKQPIPDLILSNAVRCSVIGLSKTLAIDWAADNITVNSVCPGYTHTLRVDQLAEKVAEDTGQSKQDVIAGWQSAIPAGRLGRPEELGALVAFLASEQAAYITGQSIVIDGGYYRGIA